MDEKIINGVSKDFIRKYNYLFNYISSIKRFRMNNFKNVAFTAQNVTVTLIDGTIHIIKMSDLKNKPKEDFLNILNKYGISKSNSNTDISDIKTFVKGHKKKILDNIKLGFKEDLIFDFKEKQKSFVVNINYKAEDIEYIVAYNSLNCEKCCHEGHLSSPRIAEFLVPQIKKHLEGNILALKNSIIENVITLLNNCYDDKYEFGTYNENLYFKYNNIQYNTEINLINIIHESITTSMELFKNTNYFNFICTLGANIKERLKNEKLLVDYDKWENIPDVINNTLEFYNDIYNSNAAIIFNGFSKARKTRNNAVECYSYFSNLDIIYIENMLQKITYNLKNEYIDIMNKDKYNSLMQLVNEPEYNACKAFWDNIVSDRNYSFQYKKGKGILFGNVELIITDSIKDYTINKQVDITPYNNSINLWKRKITKLFKDLDARFEKYGEAKKKDFLINNTDIVDNFLVFDILGLLKQNSSISKNDVVSVLKGKNVIDNINAEYYFDKYSLLEDNEIIETLKILQKKNLIAVSDDETYSITDQHCYDYLKPDISSFNTDLDVKIENEEILTDTESLYVLNDILLKKDLTLKDYLHVFSLFNNIRFSSRYLTEIISIFKTAPIKLKSKKESESLNMFLKMNLCSDTSNSKKKILQKILYSDKYN